jgi:hypothetical protein
MVSGFHHPESLKNQGEQPSPNLCTGPPPTFATTLLPLQPGTLAQKNRSGMFMPAHSVSLVAMSSTLVSYIIFLFRLLKYIFHADQALEGNSSHHKSLKIKITEKRYQPLSFQETTHGPYNYALHLLHILS